MGRYDVGHDGTLSHLAPIEIGNMFLSFPTDCLICQRNWAQLSNNPVVILYRW